MIKPQHVMFLWNRQAENKKVSVCVFDASLRPHPETERHKCSMGAAFSGWSQMDDEQAYVAMLWTALELIEFANSDIRFLMDQLIDRVDGFREWHNKAGRMATGRA